MEELIEVSGTVEDVVYKNAENGYIVLEIDMGGEMLTVVGNLGDIVEGEKLTLRGSYISSAKYGRQFKAETCERKMPETESEIRKYLGSGIIRGVGPAMAKKIVAKFGEESLYIIETDCMRLADIQGITADKALYIGAEFSRICSVKEIIDFLAKFNVSPMFAISAWKKYEDRSITKIRENPYVLCDDEIALDFGQVDGIAAEMGFEQYNVNRVRAGIVYVLRENAFAGHTCLPVGKLEECVCSNLGIGRDNFAEAFALCIVSETVFSYRLGEREYIYLAEYYYAECYVTDKLIQMKAFSVNSDTDFTAEISAVEFSENIVYEERQKLAISQCLQNNLFILTGGPGTGKTTTLNAVIRIYKSKGKKLLLAAPTGRAAKRMSDLTGENAKTIHRLLEVDHTKEDKLSFKHNEENQLKADAVIVDEMSMVDIQLFEALVRALKPQCKLIMVGDSNQLPSVGAGNVLKDLISSGLIPTVELKEIFRQAAQSLIVTNAHRIVAGEMPQLDERKKDFFFMSCNDENDIGRLVLDLAKRRLPDTYGYSSIDDIQILTPTKIGAVGTKELNKQLQLALNPPSRSKTEIKYYDVIYRNGDKVMQIKNDYDVTWKRNGVKGAGIFNGDIGIVKEIDAYNSALTIDFEGRTAYYTTDMLSKIEHAYAITIHKSQGSEYSAVIMPLPPYSKNLLYRNLLYTGVTRAKNILILIGRRDIVATMVDNNRKMLRYSCLNPMLQMKYRISEKNGNI